MSAENSKYPDYVITPHETRDEIRGPLNEAMKELRGMENFPNVLRLIQEKHGEFVSLEESTLTLSETHPVLRFETSDGTVGLLSVPAPLDKWGQNKNNG